MSRISNGVLTALILLLLPWSGQVFAEDPIRVVTTTPDLADIVRQVGGDRVSVMLRGMTGYARELPGSSTVLQGFSPLTYRRQQPARKVPIFT